MTPMTPAMAPVTATPAARMSQRVHRGSGDPAGFPLVVLSLFLIMTVRVWQPGSLRRRQYHQLMPLSKGRSRGSSVRELWHFAGK